MDNMEEDRIEEEEEENIPTSKLIQPKFKSKLPFSPKSYRKNYTH